MPQFITPVNGTLTQGFTSSHPGIDIGASDHSPVFAAQAGRVTFEGVWGLGGNTIILTGTDGYKTYYCHLASFLVNMGASVAQGQQIALSGGALGEAGAGNATGAHLHFEIHNPQGAALDPQTFIIVGKAGVGNTGVLPVLPTAANNNLLRDVLFPIIPITNALTGSNSPITTTASALSSAGTALGFLTKKENWVRIGEFGVGLALLYIVITKTLVQSSPIQSALKAAAKA